MTEYLSNISLRDAKWDARRSKAVDLAHLLSQTQHIKLFSQLCRCSSMLRFYQYSDRTLRLAPYDAQFPKYNKLCGRNICPICQWRGRIVRSAKTHSMMDAVQRTYPLHRWLFLTFTVRNVPVYDLRQTVNAMNKGLKRLTHHHTNGNSRLANRWPAIGWLKRLEVSHNHLTDEVHPHFHLILLVPPNYYSSDLYIKQTKEYLGWSLLWQEAMDLDYVPSCYIKPADLNKYKQRVAPTKIIPEIIKYLSKDSDLLQSSAQWLDEFVTQTIRMKTFETGGVLRQHFKFLESDISVEDLVQADDANSSGQDYDILRFVWKGDTNKMRYVLM